MKKYLYVSALATFFISAQCFSAQSKHIPEEYYSFMEGYIYEYGDVCRVTWDVKNKKLIYSGNCSILADGRAVQDALNSIDYVKKNSDAKFFGMYFAERNFYKKLAAQKEQRMNYTVAQAVLDAKAIWTDKCLSVKRMDDLYSMHFQEKFFHIDKRHVNNIYKNAENTAKFMGGVINCREQAEYSVGEYTSDIDIRKNLSEYELK